MIQEGTQPVTPTLPTALAAIGSSEGCALLSWDAPDPAEFVFEYTVYWGPPGESPSDSTVVSGPRISINNDRYATAICALAEGTFAFRIRAHNAFDLYSPLSNIAEATITGGDVTPPAPPVNFALTEEEFGCLTFRWDPSSSPTVSGYTVHFASFSVASGGISEYPNVVDVGNSGSKTICGLNEGPIYASVRAYTDGGLFSSFSPEQAIQLRGQDVAGPIFLRTIPVDGAVDIPTNQPIGFMVLDDKTGVDLNNLSVTINGEPQSDFQVQSSGSASLVYVIPSEPLLPNSSYDVSITVVDRATPGNETEKTFAFETGGSDVVDTAAPTVVKSTPPHGAKGISPFTPVSFTVSDAALGLDLSSIEMTVNGAPVSPEFDGGFYTGTVTYLPPGGFKPGSNITVTLKVCDRASPSNCLDVARLSFETSVEYASDGPGAIVPDGYWASDPVRPMEVRNLPLEWTVRIFDTAGTQVRRFRNTVSDRLTWEWDFTNDHGRRVTRALYLIRVVDNTGRVRKAGRFIVQSDQ